MKLFQLYHFFIFLSLTATSTVAQRYALPGCNDKCGNVRIPYPFGIGANCSVNKWYVVDCSSSMPYLSAVNNLEILDVDLGNQTVTVNFSMVSDCRNPVRNSSEIMNVDFGRSPFLFSKSHNKFVLEGCGNAFISEEGSVLSGCSTSCLNGTVGERNNCLGIGCCETTIPHHLKSYSMNLTGFQRQGGDGACGSAFLVDKKSYVEGRLTSDSVVAVDKSYVPVSLLWTLTDSDKFHGCYYYCSMSRVELELSNGNSMESWKCILTQPCNRNQYLIDGCDDTKECERCKVNGSNSYCSYDAIYDGDGLISRWNFTCFAGYKYTSFNLEGFVYVVLEFIGKAMGTLVLTAIIYALCKEIKKSKATKRRERFFKRLLLKQQEEAGPSVVDKTILFTSRELEKATDHFNENRILGRGGQGTVYKGMLSDGRIVAVKKSKLVDESQLELFINEVVILSQINHRNVVKLLGCCLETEVPLLVSEFISNGTLYDRIHNEADEFPISLNMRLQIATEVAGAIAYLHSATSIPIYHRDIKTTNILLDDKYRAKVSDFGTSSFVSSDQTHLTTLVKGTLGYLDPEYFQSSQFTEKSDVYSFGVVLVELLTGERPISFTRFGENKSLATYFMLAMDESRVMSIFDAMVIKEGTIDLLLAVANLAMRCLSLNGKDRPTMKEVSMELETIRMSHIPSIVQTNTRQAMYREEGLYKPKYGESTSTFLSYDDNTSQ